MKNVRRWRLILTARKTRHRSSAATDHQREANRIGTDGPGGYLSSNRHETESRSFLFLSFPLVVAIGRVSALIS